MDIFNYNCLNFNKKRVIAVQFLNRFLLLSQHSTHSPERSWQELKDDYIYLAERFFPQRQYETEISRLQQEIKVLHSRLQQSQQHPTLFTPPSSPSKQMQPVSTPQTPSQKALQQCIDREGEWAPNSAGLIAIHPIIVTPSGARHRYGERAMPDELKTAAFISGRSIKELEDEVEQQNNDPIPDKPSKASNSSSFTPPSPIASKPDITSPFKEFTFNFAPKINPILPPPALKKGMLRARRRKDDPPQGAH